jgi:hypothetical protein
MAVVSLRPNSSEAPETLMFIGGYTTISGILLGSFMWFIGLVLIPLGILTFAVGGLMKLLRRR